MRICKAIWCFLLSCSSLAYAQVSGREASCLLPDPELGFQLIYKVLMLQPNYLHRD